MLFFGSTLFAPLRTCDGPCSFFDSSVITVIELVRDPRNEQIPKTCRACTRSARFSAGDSPMNRRVSSGPAGRNRVGGPAPTGAPRGPAPKARPVRGVVGASRRRDDAATTPRRRSVSEPAGGPGPAPREAPVAAVGSRSTAASDASPPCPRDGLAGRTRSVPRVRSRRVRVHASLATEVKKRFRAFQRRYSGSRTTFAARSNRSKRSVAHDRTSASSNRSSTRTKLSPSVVPSWTVSSVVPT